MGFALLTTSMNQPFGFPGEYNSTNTENLPQNEFFNIVAAEEGAQPFILFQKLYFALFGAAGLEDLIMSEHVQPWTETAFELVFAGYLLLTVVVLINLLIAMMSDTYVRIKEQSDIGKNKTKELSLCHKLLFSNTYIFATQRRRS